VPAAEVAAQGSGPAASRAGTIELGGEVSAVRLGFGAMRLPGVWGAPNDPQQARRLLRRVIRRHCQRSLELLRLERIDLLQLHTVDPAVPIEESVGAIVDLQREGKVRMIGVSNVSVEELGRARAVGEIASVQNRYNLGDRGSEDVLAVCEGAGIGFLPWFPLGSGALAGAGELQAVASAHGATAAQVAIAWLLQRSPVLLPIPGTASIAHLEENTAAAGLRLSAEELGRLSSSVGHPRA